MKKKLLSTMLALCIVLTMLPMGVLATEEVSETSESTTTEPESEEQKMPEDAPLSDVLEPITESEETVEPIALANTVPASGIFGENLRWSIDARADKLIISGVGKIPDYEGIYADPPWYQESYTVPNMIIIQEGITGIGKEAFSSCTAMKEIIISDSVAHIGDRAFYTSGGSRNAFPFKLPNGLVSMGHQAFGQCNISSVEIPESVTDVGSSVFEASELSSVVIKNNVIGDFMFFGCGNLTDVTLSNNIESTGNQAFTYCRNLTNITIPDGVKTIGYRCFGESGLSSINLPRSITIVERAAFSDCPNLSTVNLSEGLITIGESAFSDCPKITNIVIPRSVTSIGNWAFSGCTGLKNIILSDNITTIGNEAFMNCSGLTNIVIPNAITTIKSSCFNGCSNLTDVTIPFSVKDIEHNAFAECKSLKDIYYTGTTDEWRAIKIGNNNDYLSKANIHCSDGSILAGSSETSGTYMGSHQHVVAFHSGLGNSDVEVKFDWGWNYFNTSSMAYNNNLAVAGISLCNAAVYQRSEVESMLKKLGFLVIDSQNYGQSFWGERDKPAVTFGYRRIVDKDYNSRYIFAIVIRGTKDNEDILTDLRSISGAFERSANNIYTQFENFIVNNCKLDLDDIKSESQFFVTGHSLGGATSNILAKKLNDEYGSNNVYAYTFAAPRSVNKSGASIWNIHNILNSEDQVPVVFSTQTKRYGQDIWFSRQNYAPAVYDNFRILTNGLDLKSTMESLWMFDATPFVGSMFNYAHAPEMYLAYIMSRGDAKNISAKVPRARFRCPVDVEIYTTEGLLVGRIINNEVDDTITAKTGTYIHIKEDEKTVYLPYEGEYIFKLTGTGDGIMEYSIGMVDLKTDEIESGDNTLFENVVLAPNKKMISKVKVENDNIIGADTPNVKLYVVDNDENPIREVLPDGNGTEVPITNSYKISLDANGGNIEPSMITTGVDGKLSNLPTATRKGYNFTGWFTEVTGGSRVTLDTIFTSDATIYAQWTSNGDESGNENRPSSGNTPSNKPSIESNTTNKPIFSEDNKVNVSETNTAQNNLSNSVNQKNKAPKTGDYIFNTWLYVIGILISFICINTQIKKYRR